MQIDMINIETSGRQMNRTVVSGFTNNLQSGNAISSNVNLSQFALYHTLAAHLTKIAFEEHEFN